MPNLSALALTNPRATDADSFIVCSRLPVIMISPLPLKKVVSIGNKSPPADVYAIPLTTPGILSLSFKVTSNLFCPKYFSTNLGSTISLVILVLSLALSFWTRCFLTIFSIILCNSLTPASRV